MHTAERVRRNLSLQTDAQMNTISRQWEAVYLACSDQLLCMAPEKKSIYELQETQQFLQQ